MTAIGRAPAASALVMALILAGCAGSPDGGSPAASSTSGVLDACALLSDAQIDATMGTHEPGATDLTYGGCFWPLAGQSDRRLGLYVTVLDAPEYESVAATDGVPIGDLGAAATWQETYGQLWFSCRGDRHCGVISIYDPPEKAKRDAIELGKRVLERVGS